MYKLLGGLKTYFKHQEIQTDNAVFRLHNVFTTVLLLTCSLIITATQYVGQPISCIVNGWDSPQPKTPFKTLFLWCTKLLQQQQRLQNMHPFLPGLLLPNILHVSCFLPSFSTKKHRRSQKKSPGLLLDRHVNKMKFIYKKNSPSIDRFLEILNLIAPSLLLPPPHQSICLITNSLYTPRGDV